MKTFFFKFHFLNSFLKFKNSQYTSKSDATKIKKIVPTVLPRLYRHVVQGEGCRFWGPCQIENSPSYNDSKIELDPPVIITTPLINTPLNNDTPPITTHMNLPSYNDTVQTPSYNDIEHPPQIPTILCTNTVIITT